MEIIASAIPGCLELLPPVHHDERGRFVKVFHQKLFAGMGLATNFAEEYYSISHANVLRGLHFQLPPHDHTKLVYCVAGGVTDVVVDLRKGSPSYGRHVKFELSAQRANAIYILSGMAHGFYVPSGSATMVYKVTSVYAAAHDSGILWSSAGIDWGGASPLLSKRDASLPPLAEFVSPFDFVEGRHG